MMLMLLVIGLY